MSNMNSLQSFPYAKQDIWEKGYRLFPSVPEVLVSIPSYLKCEVVPDVKIDTEVGKFFGVICL